MNTNSENAETEIPAHLTGNPTLDAAILSMVAQVRRDEMVDYLITGEELAPDLVHTALFSHEQARQYPGLPDWVLAEQPAGTVIVLIITSGRIYVHYVCLD